MLDSIKSKLEEVKGSAEKQRELLKSVNEGIDKLTLERAKVLENLAILNGAHQAYEGLIKEEESKGDVKVGEVV